MYKKKYLLKMFCLFTGLQISTNVSISASATTDQGIPILDFSEPSESTNIPLFKTNDSLIVTPPSPITQANKPEVLQEISSDVVPAPEQQANPATPPTTEAIVNPTNTEIITEQTNSTTTHSSKDSNDGLLNTTEEEIGAGAIGAGAIGLGIKTFVVDQMKEKASDKIKEKMTPTKKKQTISKSNIRLQKQLINDRHVQAARKVDYYSKTNNTAKQEKWNKRLKRSKKLQANIDQQKELSNKNKMKSTSEDERKLNALEQKKLSKEVLNSEQQRLNARLHKYDEQSGELSQKQLIKKEQTKNSLKTINQESSNEPINKTHKKTSTGVHQNIGSLFNRGRK